MKSTRLAQNLIFIVPIVSVFASVGIVAHQTARRNQLENKLTTNERERSTLEKRYKELRKAAGLAADPGGTPAGSESHH